jgi:proline dehydrogenase
MALDFSNTEIAFRGKTDSNLKKSYYLFRMVASPGLVNFGSWAIDVSFKCRLPVKGLIKKTIFNQFCGGETIEECTAKIQELHKNNVGTILDYSLEGKESDEDLDQTTNEIIKTIERAKSDSAIPFSVFKPTGIAKFSLLEKSNNGVETLSEKDQLDYEKVRSRFHKICGKAHELNVPVFIDAEDSWIQDAIDTLAEEMIFAYNKETAIVYNTVQLYRWDRLDYLKNLHQKALQHSAKVGVKLVRGAYMEKERARAEEKGYKDPIQPNKESTDRDYDLALEYCVNNITDFGVCAGSHNEKSAIYLSELIEKKGLEKNDPRIYFAQLLGMSDHISFNLSFNQYNVAKYVPYGPVKEVMPYLIRRARENTSVAGQTGRELSLIIQERKRRKQNR